ncbi:hypothetical protein [Alicyclobacillus sp. ALC3]|uniref:hypothetical protein n=1 Tax=Alicyclobacillus sp. ALC3 TaxID=2796143 RepID=UPI0023785B39|nr:hypothetical protein [Alicyclobacillus sp. ALC3]WDL95894.1 hypothetical protein JC200_16255 [Alicyclobacillus sp. ALC3]
MTDDERVIAELKTLRKIECSKPDTEMIWQRLENQISEDYRNHNALDSDTLIHCPQFNRKSPHDHPLDRLSASRRDSISMNGRRFNPNGGDGHD